MPMSCLRKKNTGKVPRKIHKAAREKLKRDHMNELFLDLGKALGGMLWLTPSLYDI